VDLKHVADKGCKLVGEDMSETGVQDF